MDRIRNALARAIASAAASRDVTPGEIDRERLAGLVQGLETALALIDASAAPLPNGERFLCVTGTPLTGLAFFGPFLSWAEAEAWGERNAPGAEFWIAPLTLAPPPAGPRLIHKRED